LTFGRETKWGVTLKTFFLLSLKLGVLVPLQKLESPDHFCDNKLKKSTASSIDAHFGL
jgi:hypothetical protein